MRACASEESETACALLAEALPPAALAQVAFVAVDNPSCKYYDMLKTICPGLQGMSLDTIHLAMTCEYATARRKSKATRALRRILSKFAAVDCGAAAESFGRMYTGRACKDLTAEEERYRRHIEDLTMRDEEAARVLRDMNYEEPFYTRVEWIQAVAALANSFRDDMRRMCPGPNRRVWQLLHTATAPERTEWYMNNIRIRHSLSARKLSLLPVGTTSNESLHAEINRWFKETQKLHKATLDLKLQILQAGKLLSHNRALYHVSTKQMTHSEVLARATREPLWTMDTWSSWCGILEDAGTARLKADLPFEQSRKFQQSEIRAAQEKPATAPKQAEKRHRTPHTLKRQDGMVRGGKRPCGS